MALSTVTKNLNDGSIQLSDGTGSPVTLWVTATIGDFSIDDIRAASGITSQQNEVTAYEARGRLDGVRHTTRIYPTGSFTAHLKQWHSASAGEVLNFIRKADPYASNASTLGANADVYTLKVTLVVEGTDHGDDADSTIVLDDCHCTASVAEGDPNTVTISFTCYGAITYTGTS